MPSSYVTLDGASVPVRVEGEIMHFPYNFFNGNNHKNVDTFPRDTSDRIFCGFAIFVFAIIFGACCLNCCCLIARKRRQQKQQQSDVLFNSPVVVTSATHTAPGGYPVTTLPATNYQTNSYGTPYPAQTSGPNVTVQMPMPMPSAQPPMPGMQPHVAPYPPMQQFPGAGASNMNPPSYDMAMANSGPTVVPAGYEKQMPYNPNY